MIYGIGCDILDITRIEKLYEKEGDRFVNRILSDKEKERLNSFSNPKKQIEYIAKRFAAKEAFSKALGSGLGSEVSFKDISVLNDEKGAPFIELPYNFYTNGRENIKIHISISDEWPNAVAFVIISK